MSDDAMSIDHTAHIPSELHNLLTLTAGPLSSSLSGLSGSARTIPSSKDFYFYYNFDEFKHPIQQITATSQSLLDSIGSSNRFLKEKLQFPGDFDIDDSYDWLVNMNDEILECFDFSIDEFQSIRNKGDETGSLSGMDSESGFQLVYGRKKKVLIDSGRSTSETLADSRVKVADMKAKKSKSKVSFHIPTLKKPQEEYSILVNNSNVPFEHVWLQRSEDGSRLIHPLENLSVLDFVDESSGDVEPLSPVLLEQTPFKLVEEVKDLKALAAKLRSVNEFAVDLEHNQYRSFQGLTCLMQISTRTEDFIIDTLKLRIHVGPYLREVFKDPSKKKVMHGADRDIVWLQRDFGIYVCNLFDTGQASRVLNLERNSLEYLLQHFCGITANKEYQNADWRLRPLPDVMVRYGREDTHYLLYIYDKMKAMLLSMPKNDESSDSPLLEVYKCSYDVCMQLYEKELLTESSYMHLYGLQNADLNAQQLAIVAGLFEWRDVVARTQDESTGYVLPNKTLIEIAKQMPVTAHKLHRLLKSKHPYIERNLDYIVNIIKHTMQNAAEFEVAAKSLKEVRLQTVIGASVQAKKRPTSAFGALFGSGTSKRTFESAKKDKEKVKLESIRNSVKLPFHSFIGRIEQLEEKNEKPEISHSKESSCGAPARIEEIVMLSDESDEEGVQNKSESKERSESLSDLSTSFQKCFKSIHQNPKKSQEPSGLLQLKPFDYGAASILGKTMREGKSVGNEDQNKLNHSGGKKMSQTQKKDNSTPDFQQGKRRQAFPASGNRSATYR